MPVPGSHLGLDLMWELLWVHPSQLERELGVGGDPRSSGCLEHGEAGEGQWWASRPPRVQACGRGREGV